MNLIENDNHLEIEYLQGKEKLDIQNIDKELFLFLIKNEDSFNVKILIDYDKENKFLELMAKIINNFIEIVISEKEAIEDLTSDPDL